MPATDPVLRVCIQNCDPVAPMYQLCGKQQNGGGLARTTLGIGEGNHRHLSLRGSLASMIAPGRTFMMPLPHSCQSWLTKSEEPDDSAATICSQHFPCNLFQRNDTIHPTKPENTR